MKNRDPAQTKIPPDQTLNRPGLSLNIGLFFMTTWSSKRFDNCPGNELKARGLARKTRDTRLAELPLKVTHMGIYSETVRLWGEALHPVGGCMKLINFCCDAELLKSEHTHGLLRVLTRTLASGVIAPGCVVLVPSAVLPFKYDVMTDWHQWQRNSALTCIDKRTRRPPQTMSRM